jgi:hypothetical protein
MAQTWVHKSDLQKIERAVCPHNNQGVCLALICSEASLQRLSFSRQEPPSNSLCVQLIFAI